MSKVNSVVRNKVDRENLKGTTCKICEGFFSEVSVEYCFCALFQRLLINSPILEPPHNSNEHPRVVLALLQMAYVTNDIAAAAGGRGACKCDHVQKTSRHRHQFSPPKTPDNYWQVGWESTQESRT